MSSILARRLPSVSGHWTVLVMLAYLVAAVGVWLGLWGQQWAVIGREAWLPPSEAHWLGTNRLGQDLLERSLRATATAFETGLPVAALAMASGALLGAIAAYRPGKWVDRLVLWLAGSLDAIPFYLFVAALAFALQGHPWGIQLAMVLTFWTPTARIVRAEARRILTLPFIEAARVAGRPAWRIIVDHVLPNLSHLLGIQLILIFVASIKAEVVLSFLGLGDLGKVSWGIMLAEAAQDILSGQYMNLIVATASLLGLVMASNLLIDRHLKAPGPGLRHA